MFIIESIYDEQIKIENDDSFFFITKDMIKGEFKAGDVLIKNSDGLYETDFTATEKIRRENITMQNDLFE